MRFFFLSCCLVLLTVSFAACKCVCVHNFAFITYVDDVFLSLVSSPFFSLISNGVQRASFYLCCACMCYIRLIVFLTLACNAASQHTGFHNIFIHETYHHYVVRCIFFRIILQSDRWCTAHWIHLNRWIHFHFNVTKKMRHGVCLYMPKKEAQEICNYVYCCVCKRSFAKRDAISAQHTLSSYVRFTYSYDIFVCLPAGKITCFFGK